MVMAQYQTRDLGGYDRIDGGNPTGAINNGAKAHALAGFTSITYRGRDIYADDNCTPSTFFWLNSDYLEFDRLIDQNLNQVSSNVQVTEGYYKGNPAPSAWQFREMMSPVNQYGEVGALLLMGNFICRQPRRNGKLTGVLSN